MSKNLTYGITTLKELIKNINNLNINGEGGGDYIKTIDIINGKKLKVEFRTKQTSSAYPIKTLTLSRVGIKLQGDEEYLKINSMQYLDYRNNNIFLNMTPESSLTNNDIEYITTTPPNFNIDDVVLSDDQSEAKVKLSTSGAYIYGHRYEPYYCWRDYNSNGISTYLADDGTQNPFYTLEAELSKPIKEFKFTPWASGVGGIFYSENLNVKLYIDDVLIKNLTMNNPMGLELYSNFHLKFNIQGDKLIINELEDLEYKLSELEKRIEVLEKR